MRVLRLLTLLVLIVAVAACSRGTRQDRYSTMSADALYEVAHESLLRNNNTRAIRHYQRLIARFPFGTYTEQSHLEMAYAQYRLKEHDQAISTIDRFLKTYPTHADADYAQYLRGVVNFYREASFVGRYINLDASRRDQGATRQSFTDFSKLLRDHPNSSYADDARQRMVFLRNSLARHEVLVAQYYLRRGAYVAAVNRSKHVLENYQQSPESGDALAIMIEAYSRLGEQALADDTRRVLELNYPDHPFLQGESPLNRKALWRRMVPFA